MTHADCIFCKIASGKIPTSLIAQNEHAVVFADRNPQAPTHLLVVPKTHIININHLNDSHQHIAWAMLKLVQEVARTYGTSDDTGFKLVANNGGSAGQVVFHMHWHFLSGKKETVLPE